MTKQNLIHLLLSICLLYSCKEKVIIRGVVLVERQNIMDSAVITHKSDIDILNDFFKNKQEVYYKFPRKYHIKLYFSNGNLEEYDGFDTLVRSNVVYTSTDIKFRNNYFKMIDSIYKRLSNR